VTAKDFRTWAGTVEAALVLNGLAARHKQPTKADVRAAFDGAARRLANTAAICRKCYVHPDVIESYETGNFLLSFPHRKSRGRFALTNEETAVLRFIESCRRKGRR
jgi:DNA topoisomerase-1